MHNFVKVSSMCVRVCMFSDDDMKSNLINVYIKYFIVITSKFGYILLLTLNKLGVCIHGFTYIFNIWFMCRLSFNGYKMCVKSSTVVDLIYYYILTG